MEKICHDCLEEGADVNKPSGSDDLLPLIKASVHGHWECVELLITAGANVNITHSENETAIFHAAKAGNIKCLDLLVKNGGNVNTTNNVGVTPLMYAAHEGRGDCVKLLVDAGADVNMVDEGGCTALINASCLGSMRCVEILLKAGADVNAHTTGQFGFSALSCSAQEGHFEVLDFLLENEADVKLLNEGVVISIAQNGFGEILCRLVRAGVDVNHKDSHHYTALINAASNGMEKGVHALIEAGADVNERECDLTTPLMFAATGGHLNCIKLLIKAGAHLNATANFGKTALMFASWNGHYKCVDTLIEAGADVNMVCDFCQTAITGKWRAWGDDYKCIESLIAAGADVNIADQYGFSSGHAAMLLAASDNNATKIRLYLKAGMYINETGELGFNVLSEYIYYGGMDCTKEVSMLLYAAGEKIDGTTIQEIRNDENDVQNEVLNYVLKTELRLCLKHMCRVAIRKHLIELNPKLHLFDRIPKLKLDLPSVLPRYLLYDLSLDLKQNATGEIGGLRRHQTPA